MSGMNRDSVNTEKGLDNKRSKKSNNDSIFSDVQNLFKATIEGNIFALGDSMLFKSSEKVFMSEMKKLLKAALEGNMGIRGDSSLFMGDKADLIESMNELLCTIGGLAGDISSVSESVNNGELSSRLDEDKFSGDFQKIIKDTNTIVDSVSSNVSFATQYFDRIAKGETQFEITDVFKGEYDALKNAINKCSQSIGIMVDEVGVVINAAKEGKLDDRANADRVPGVYRKVLRGINDTLDALITPLKECENYFERIANGDTQFKITDEYKGEFNNIKSSINKCSEAIAIMVDEVGVVIDAAKEGKLDLRANADRTTGVYRKILRGINSTIGSMVNPLLIAEQYFEKISKGEVPPDITEEYKGDFEKIKNSLNRCAGTLRTLVADVAHLTQAAVAGKLSVRADVSKHKGEYATIMQGINDTLDGLVVPVMEAAKVLEKVAANDLTARVTGDYNGDHAKIKESLNTAIDNLSIVLSQVVDSVNQVSSAAQQINISAQGVADGTNTQASSLEEISSSIEEMSSMTKNNSENALQAQNLAKEANLSAEKGKSAMERMNTAIEDIKKSSDKTAKIVKTIDEIAFQTNLLALNAAVEAARAGEAGKGFAVVAEEVRNLAMRSAAAAKDTANMIEESVKNAENGVKLAAEVDKSLVDIAAGTGKVNNLVSEIADASREQYLGIENVNLAVGQVDKVTQKNAAIAEQSANAATELSAQSGQLAEMVSSFELARFSEKIGNREVAELIKGIDAGMLKQFLSQQRKSSIEASVGVARKDTNVGRFSTATIKPEKLIPFDAEDYGDF